MTDAYLIKARIDDPSAATFVFGRAPTMYGGRKIAAGDRVYLVASEHDGGAGLIARGTVIAADPVPRKAGVVRQTPCVSVTVERTALARRPFGRTQLKAFTDWDDGRPETELNFKFYRQATNKIGGISAAAAAFLDRFF
jgi:hypothetical protein